MSIKDKDMVGKKFGRWLVLERALYMRSNRYHWTCRCECGTVKDVSGTNLRNGTSSSCGCFQRELSAINIKKHSEKHSMHKTRFYTIWHNMKQRCNNPNNHGFQYYGGRGVKVCAEWGTFESFKRDLYDLYTEQSNFFGETNISIERIDVNSGYEPGNVRFATKTEQILNRRTPKNNTSGCVGVNFVKKENKWEARIWLYGEQKYLGSFTNKEDAIEARKLAELDRDAEVQRVVRSRTECDK